MQPLSPGYCGPPWADLLHQQVPARMRIQIGDAEDGVEVVAVAVQVGGDHDLVRQIGVELHHVALAARCIAVRFGGPVELRDDLIDGFPRCGHNIKP